MSTNKNSTSWLASLLTGWGVKESWAKIIAGAIIGALAAAGILTQSSCSNISDEQIQRIEAVHDLYHAISGKDCIFCKPTDK